MSVTRGVLFQAKAYNETIAPSTVTWGDLPTRYNMNQTLTNIVWSQLPSKMWTAAFNSNSYGQVAALSSKQLNFTSDSFTILTWMYASVISSAQYIVCQGATDADGWGFFVFTNNLSLRLNQAAAHTDISAVNGFYFNRWQQVGVTRTGNTGQFYNNGVAITTIGGGGLTNAVSVNGGNKFLVGIADGEVLNGLTASLCMPKIWNYTLTGAEINRCWESERRFFGV
jgi:hypothetical protein